MIIGAKFGYINKKIYLMHASSTCQSYKYELWNELESMRLIKPYSDPSFSKNYFYLSQAAKSIVLAHGRVPVSKVSPIYFSHDNAVMKFALANESKTQILSDWQTEASLRLLDNHKIHQIFGGQVGKFPDLLVNLNVSGQKIKIALEVERSAKNQSRYDAFAIGYSKAKGVDLVLVAYGYKFTRDALLISMRRIGYPRSVRPIAFCNLSEFIENPSKVNIEIEGHRIGFSEYIKNIQDLIHKNQLKVPENDSGNNSGKI